MEKFGLFEAIENQCENIGYKFIPSEDAEYSRQVQSWDTDEIGIICEFSFGLSFGQMQQHSKITYTGAIGIFKKRTQTDIASLDQSFYQKYKSTLKNLPQLLTLFVQRLACENGLTITKCDSDWQINILDECIDGIRFDLIFEHES